jgi:4a-hydroxytetrahydrobiopterin dehydratase
MTEPLLTASDIRAAHLTDWRLFPGTLAARYRTGDFQTGRALVNAIAAAAEAADHHPELVLTFGRVDVRLSSHDAGGVTRRDVDLAGTISLLAAAAGVPADPDSLSALECGLDAAVPERIRPFWAALLGAADVDGEVRDPEGVLPPLWFQVPDHEPSGDAVPQRWHFDVWVPADQVQPRIVAALAAGGRLVDDSHAPSFWVLADADGNRSCLCVAGELAG